MTRTTWHNCQPIDLHRLARNWFIDARRIELQKLAVELGISRATAYRWAGSAEALVGEVLASLVDESFQQIVQRTTSHGSAKVLEVLETGMRYAHTFKPLQQFLARDPQTALKLVASKHGPVQRRTMANLERLMREEVAAGHMSLPVDAGVMAFALTRITESFLYSDLITDTKLDLKNASRILHLMLKDT
ncbi:MAG: QsdR family transcriptional regulator [Proteobacteria bacterium]|nr:QsdR family transcriptional regulator [Pseudomonadota bacterium]